MRMISLAVLAALFPATTAAAAAPDGKAVFDKACAACHFERRDPARMNDMVAPPMDMMAVHVREAVKNDRAAFVQRVVGYIKAPSAEAAVDANAIQRFGLMPSIRDTFPDLTDADLDAVAGWLYDYYADARLPTAEQQQQQQKLRQQSQ